MTRPPIAEAVNPAWFNPDADLPYGLTVDDVRRTMEDFIRFVTSVNGKLLDEGIDRLENLMMPAGYSSMVGEHAVSTIPKYCDTLVKNQWHNGHPDILPKGEYPRTAKEHGEHGIEVKGSRYITGWQGHNRERSWLMVFCFDSNRPLDVGYPLSDEEEAVLRAEEAGGEGKKPKKIQRPQPPKPFRFLLVAGAQLEEDDWSEAPRKPQLDDEGNPVLDEAGNPVYGRRTATASIIASGRKKMLANWIYRVPELDAWVDATAQGKRLPRAKAQTALPGLEES
jgi:hypothetical protein